MSSANDIPEAAGRKNILVCCDESGTDGKRFYGFGSLWMRWERRGDFLKMIDGLRHEYGYRDEIKWNRITQRSHSFYSALVSEFFKTRTLMFHCVLVRRGYVKKELHGRGTAAFDLARRKHFAMLLKSKMRFFGDSSTAYHAWVDPLPSSYARAGDAAAIIINNSLRARLNHPLLVSLRERDSKEVPGIQLADFLLGAVVTSWNNDWQEGSPKSRVAAEVARHLGWDDLRADTHHKEWKFNIWAFHDPTQGLTRETKTRRVELLHPMPPFGSFRSQK